MATYVILCNLTDQGARTIRHQYAAATCRDRADGSPEPVDPALAALAVAWAARDVTSYADGGRPSTWSTTLVLAHDLATLETRSWLRHPECGCGWA